MSSYCDAEYYTATDGERRDFCPECGCEETRIHIGEILEQSFVECPECKCFFDWSIYKVKLYMAKHNWKIGWGDNNNAN